MNGLIITLDDVSKIRPGSILRLKGPSGGPISVYYMVVSSKGDQGLVPLSGLSKGRVLSPSEVFVGSIEVMAVEPGTESFGGLLDAPEDIRATLGL